MNLSTLLLCGCPVDAEITDITVSSCPENFGQIQKIIFQRIFSTGSTKNKIAQGSGAGGIEVLASWSALLSAADGTKVQISPFIENPTFEPGDKREFGGGNATLDGVPKIIGSNPTTFEAIIYSSGQATILEMKDLMCETLGVYFVNEDGKIAGKLDGTDVYPIPIQQLFIGDKKFGGYDEPDANKITFSLKANWSDALTIETMSDFNPLTDLSGS